MREFWTGRSRVRGGLILAFCLGACTTTVESAEVYVAPCEPGPQATCMFADLSGADLSDLDLSQADFRGADLSGADLSGSSMFASNFSAANLSGADLSDSVLVETRFDEAIMVDANLASVRVLRGSFWGADLSGASFRLSQLTMGDFTNSTGFAPTNAYLCRILPPKNREDLCLPGSSYRPIKKLTYPPDRTRAVPDPVGDVMEVAVPLMARSLRSNPLWASRVYAYMTIAAAAAGGSEKYATLLRNSHVYPTPPPFIHAAVASSSAATAAATLLYTAKHSRIRHPENFSDVPIQALYNPRDVLVDSVLRLKESDEDTIYNSVLWGTKIAQAVVDGLADTDGAEEVPMVDPEYTPPVNRDFTEWVPTPPSEQPPLAPNWDSVSTYIGDITPCVAPDPLDGGPPSLRRHRLAAAAEKLFEMTSNLGEEAMEIATFWDDGVGSSATPPGHWIQIARLTVPETNLDDRSSSVVYADLAVAMHNSLVAVWRDKYKWNIARPVTVAESMEVKWDPYLATPPHPEYPSGHAALSAAAALVLTHHLGSREFTDPGLSLTIGAADLLDVKPRHFVSFTAAAEEAAISRVYGGIHYELSAVHGSQLGRCVAEKVVSGM